MVVGVSRGVTLTIGLPDPLPGERRPGCTDAPSWPTDGVVPCRSTRLPRRAARHGVW
jgi:hypothetical protein